MITKRHILNLTTRFISVMAGAALLTAALAQNTYACTGVYVGKDISADGTYIIARSNDSQGTYPSRMVIIPEKKDAAGRRMLVGSIDSAMADIPSDTYKYTGTPFMTSMIESQLQNNYDYAACTNDQGVVLSGTVTAFANDTAIKADPYVKTGVSESGMDQLLICQIASAREGVELLASLIDKYGMSNAETIVFADQNEAWYMELYTGHQYAAVKLPNDKVATYGNEFSLRFLSEYEDSICSKELESLPKSKGFAVYADNGELDILETYSGKDMFIDYSHKRTWIGHETLAEKKYGKYDTKAYYDFTYVPQKKVSVTDVMNLMRNRFEGTEYCPDGTDVINSRVIGSEVSLSVHVLQVYPKYPKEISCVTWLCEGPATCGVFVPLSNGCDSVSASYGRDESLSDLKVVDSEKYPYYASKETTTYGVLEFDAYAKPIQKYWSDVEANMTNSFAGMLEENAKLFTINPNKAIKSITQYCNEAQETAFADQKEILNLLRYRLCSDSNSMKVGRNPETHEVLTEKKKLEKLEIDLSAGKYGF